MSVYCLVKRRWNIYEAAAVLIVCILCHGAENFGQAASCSPEGNVRLEGFNSTLAGYVEICKNGTWMKLLTTMNSWTHKNSIVVCQQLGLAGALWLSSKLPAVSEGFTVNKTLRASVECTGTEQTLSSCTRVLNSSLVTLQYSFVACREAPSEGDIRLVAISSIDSEGLVEFFHPRRAYSWSTVCTNGWDDVEADIVCKQLGYTTGKSKFYSSLDVSGQQQLPRKRYNNFKCNGAEPSLSQCQHDGPYPYKCYSETYAGVICQNYDDPVRLHVPPTAAFLVLVTGALLLLLVVVALLVKCVVKKFKKKQPPLLEQGLDGSPDTHRRVSRVRLDTQTGWNHSTTTDGYSLFSNPVPAPPSYADTIRVDQATQNQLSLQTEHESPTPPHHVTHNTDQTNEHST